MRVENKVYPKPNVSEIKWWTYLYLFILSAGWVLKWNTGSSTEPVQSSRKPGRGVCSWWKLISSIKQIKGVSLSHQKKPINNFAWWLRQIDANFAKCQHFYHQITNTWIRRLSQVINDMKYYLILRSCEPLVYKLQWPVIAGHLSQSLLWGRPIKVLWHIFKIIQNYIWRMCWDGSHILWLH